MTRDAIQRHRPNGHRLEVVLYRVPATQPRLARLHVLTGPGDHGEHVLTICLPHED